MTRVTVGDTVRLIVEFYDFNGDPIDPTSITITVENKQREILLQESITGADHVLNDKGLAIPGQYYYDFETTEVGIQYYYFKGTINGTPGLRNGSFSVMDIDGTGGRI